MLPFQTPFPPRDTGFDWLRLRTFISLRWLAIAGQLAAILVAVLHFDIVLDTGLCLLAVGLSVVLNLFSTVVFPQNRRLSESEATQLLLFDIAQLAFLLFLTGGLTNPFAFLILAPVTISASALHLRSTLILGGCAIALVSLLAFVYVPLRTSGAETLRLPPLFAFGFWLAIVIGIVFLGVYAHRVAREIRTMSNALLATQMALSREQKLTDLGGVVAAAAHELGTPLATIKLVSSELVDELADQPALREDAALIRAQADRCRDILRSMGQAGKDDLHMRQAPLLAVLREAAEPHQARGKTVIFDVVDDMDMTGDGAGDGPAADRPLIRRQPEVIHGIRNLIQNAVDFARGTVRVQARWSAGTLRLQIADDGPGFPPHLLGRIGDPFVRDRREPRAASPRAEYEGMGLGLFIAKTLLERTGAELTFANGENGGAVVEVVWPETAIAAPAAALGENPAIG